MSLRIDAGIVLPGAEELRCVELVSPQRELFASGFSVEKTGVHHVNLWRLTRATEPGPRACPTTWPYGEFILDDSSAGRLETSIDGAVLHLGPSTPLLASVHVLNTTPERIDAGMTVMFQESERRAPLAFGFFADQGRPLPASVPPRASVTLRYDAPPVALSLFAIMGHQHAHGTLETVTVNGEEIYRSESWSDPVVTTLALELRSTDSLEWSCSVMNTSTKPLTWGENSVQGSEMCGLFGLASKPWNATGILR